MLQCIDLISQKRYGGGWHLATSKIGIVVRSKVLRVQKRILRFLKYAYV